MLPSVDARTALEAGTSLVAAAVTIATLKADIRWIRRWMSEHKRDDAQQFQNVRSELAELRAMFHSRPGV